MESAREIDSFRKDRDLLMENSFLQLTGSKEIKYVEIVGVTGKVAGWGNRKNDTSSVIDDECRLVKEWSGRQRDSRNLQTDPEGHVLSMKFTTNGYFYCNKGGPTITTKIDATREDSDVPQYFSRAVEELKVLHDCIEKESEWLWKYLELLTLSGKSFVKNRTELEYDGRKYVFTADPKRENLVRLIRNFGDNRAYESTSIQADFSIQDVSEPINLLLKHQQEYFEKVKV